MGFLLFRIIFFCRVLDIRVPKLVKADMGQMVVLQEKREMGRNVIRGKGRAVGPLEDEVVFLVIGAAELSVDPFLGFGLDKDFSRLGR